VAEADAEALGMVKRALEETGSHMAAVEYMLKMRYLSDLGTRRFNKVRMIQEDAMAPFSLEGKK